MASSRTKKKASGPLSQARAAEIFEIAKRALMQLGVAGFTMDEVAIRARCSKPTLYRRWGNKSRLIIDIVNSHKIQFSAIDTGSLREDLRVLLGRIVEGWHRQGMIFLGIAHSMQNDAELAAAWHSRGFAGGKANLELIAANAIRRGELSRRPNLELLYNVVPGSFLWALYVEQAPNLQAYAENLLEMVLLPFFLNQQAPIRRVHKKPTTK